MSGQTLAILTIGTALTLGGCSAPSDTHPTPAPDPSPSPTVGQIATELATRLPAMIETARIPGLAVALIDNGEVTWVGLFG